MRIGFFGKLPAKRDFIAVEASRAFLLVWEAWLQGGLKASMHSLGDAWRPSFLKAPIWRFWLGSEICGQTVMGAFMPSIDGIGRYFPLSVFAHAADGELVPPPEFDQQTPWFSDVEDLLLSALDHDATVEALTDRLNALPPVSDRLPPFASRDASMLTDGSIVLDADQETFADVFASARMAGHAQSYSGLTYWWTAGGQDYPARMLTRRGMPDPFVFAGMLTGDFSALET